MTSVDCCPACGGRRFRPFSFTVAAERNGDMHVAQTRCRDCDLVFSNPVAGPDELGRFYRAEYYEGHEQVNAKNQDLEQIIRDRALGEAEGLRGSVLPYVQG